MKGKNRHKRKKIRCKFLLVVATMIGIVTIGTALYVIDFSGKGVVWTSPEEFLVEYMEHIPEQEYEQMYAMLNIEASGNIK